MEDIELETVTEEEFERIKEIAETKGVHSNGEYGSYKSYHLTRIDGREVIRVNEYISQADGEPYDTTYYVCD
jgi:hypothetical protein